jgi:hypothetical protein
LLGANSFANHKKRRMNLVEQNKTRWTELVTAAKNRTQTLDTDEVYELALELIQTAEKPANPDICGSGKVVEFVQKSSGWRLVVQGRCQSTLWVGTVDQEDLRFFRHPKSKLGRRFAADGELMFFDVWKNNHTKRELAHRIFGDRSQDW